MSLARHDSGLEALLAFLRRARGFDLTGYKRASLERRFRRRMDAIGCRTHGDYLDYIEVHPEEYERLFDTLLINVTGFFRDRPAWDHLSQEVLPRLLDAKPADEPFRVWSAGCSTGQEAYTTAMMLAEALGEGAYRERVKIFATDIDEDALGSARLGVYSRKEVEPVPGALRDRYFECAGQKLAFREDLRRTVLVSRNNLVSDAPISRLDLLICRNTLMYFTAETQGRILRHFHFALVPHGVLMLGRSETMIAHRELFEAIDGRKRTFRRRQDGLGLRSPLAALADDDATERRPPSDDRATRDAALELGPHPQLIVARSGELTFVNLPARALFGISHEDVGRPFSELEVARAPADLLPAFEQALHDCRCVELGEHRFLPREGDERRLDVTLSPLVPEGGSPYGVSVVFADVSRYATLRRDVESSPRDLELAYEELQSTIDELETTNEELESANEELQTTNEVLQSSNEELETIDDELRERTSELDRVTDLLESILTALAVGVAVVDREQRVQVWNRRAEDLWGLRRDEAVDHRLLSLDIGLAAEQLAGPLRAVLAGASKREHAVHQVVDRRGRTIACSTTILPLTAPGAADGQPVRGAIVLMGDAPAST